MLSLIITPDRNLTCLTITYTHRMISFMDIDISIIRDNDSLITTVRLEKKVITIIDTCLYFKLNLKLNQCLEKNRL